MRISKELDEQQPWKQADCRSQITCRLPTYLKKDKCQEYSIPLCVAFADYGKIFNSVEKQAILQALKTREFMIDILIYQGISMQIARLQ